MVYQVYEAVKIPIVGIGGVTTAEDAVEMLLAGATAVGVGAANCIDPYASKKIIDDLPEVMEKYGIDSLRSVIGGAH
jgi:dihydroorotate dehydrogenase (NAD+) catalytic subunit